MTTLYLILYLVSAVCFALAAISQQVHPRANLIGAGL